MSMGTSASDTSPSAPSRSTSRGFSPVLAAVIIVVVLVIAGAGTFFLLAPYTSKATSATHQTCWPPTSPLCGVVTTTTSYGATVTSAVSTAQQGVPVPLTMTIPNYVAGRTYSYTFFTGDGHNVSGYTSTLEYSYNSAGSYYVLGMAKDNLGNVYYNLQHILHITVNPSFAGDTLGNLAEAGGVVLSNSTSTSNPTTILMPGGSVTLEGQVVSLPTNAVWIVQNISFNASTVSGITVTNIWSSLTAGNTSIQANVSVASTVPMGVYPVVFTITTMAGTQMAQTYYIFTVVVGASGHPAGVLKPPVRSPPTPGTMNIYELVPAGAASEDPAIDYETVGYEVILNVYGTLIRYNGSHAGPDPSDFVPMIATCVPGSAQCTKLYGSTLVNGNSTTFVINPNASFYDPNTGQATPVTSYDVVFSIARTCLFSTYPSYQVNPGWIICQALLPGSSAVVNVPNPYWDGGLHTPLNNTPQNILNAVTAGTSPTCMALNSKFGIPASQCVTFNTNLSNEPWPEFLEFIADPLGGSIMDCAWASAHGAGLPGWTNCDGVPSPSSLTLTAWDSYMLFGAPANYNTYLQYHLVGSGPYYVANYQIGSSYELKANPDWKGTTCVGGTANGCLPGPYNGTNYMGTVSVIWETTQTPGETALALGTADSATIPSTDTPFLLQEERKGVVGAEIIPTLAIYFYPMDLYFNPSLAQQYISQKVTAPANLFQDYNFRHFMLATMPYATVQSTINTVDGIEYAFQYGGAIPDFMGDYYPRNISWPSGNPVSNPAVVGGAAYWWAQVENETGALAIARTACTTSNPCTFPLMTQSGDPGLDATDALWVSEVSRLSGGAVNMIPVDVSFVTLVINSFSAPTQNPMPIFTLAWAPDYPDPSDYVGPILSPNSTYTYGDAVAQSMDWGPSWSTAASNWDSPCGGHASDPAVTYACQGWAYNDMVHILTQAGACVSANHCSNAERVLLYNMAENIANQLGLYVWNGQANEVYDYASWINPASLNANPMLTGEVGDQTWYTWQYAAGA